ncbi:MAG: hypothetical protein KUA43_11460 [Hoeflea sp.]|uniref:hypothetical protein n=1 Tax=Hoeflea sp. TaxID=1940281 RepID=UPI001DE9059B|nr:hypothetical protein [Hoeflea sp.]MBU4527627.1 hypothetical protein [Alphaproteobacteria bacterium]MBU4546505.1 hypothetical protein [Alphaproteobacteria bacterium]MBU4552977.1 hypothetical protein [Alphaproteobacteria bacterium]MBV1724049.1 hypothetical protein [Hoeflea sp.]MBV1759734.1 hypothetical protein [Hoeflea sp.]
MTTHSLDLDPIALKIDASVGHIADLKIRDGDRILSPLHRAPWVDDPQAEFPAGTAPNVKRLSGDFFCAPFGRNDVEDAPSHGWPANSAWDHLETIRQDDRVTIAFRLKRRVMGATVDKRITLIAGHPFVYQEHVLVGGAGAVSAAHHVMVHMADGGDLAFSPKQSAWTPPEALEPDSSRGRSILAYPAQTSDLTAFPLAGGGFADLTRYPPGERHEDFLTLVEEVQVEASGNKAPGGSLGWSAVSRNAEQDHVIVLKRPELLPVTMLWMSNGGRDYAPWSGRHTGVLGIEDARASPLGHADSCGENEYSRSGVPTAFALGPDNTIIVRQVIGACAARAGYGKVTGIEVESDFLVLQFVNGGKRSVNYAPDFLAV